ncbi:hypothetical protein G6O69_01190 [Pseudenhygromyxa sp. WMMC2535]|uniref:hypothetical protein n=1 Tax=Pseudenhygromyxa sp. WMMC2535 TaxID=2712867 RepID=UPI00155524B6|nr:hypothetical protein [Pseudenhygromyxa sp. WMMC2535]NVB36426.1 hypothetical protein [Pseudenhygromyxa sp. WMMC2535]
MSENHLQRQLRRFSTDGLGVGRDASSAGEGLAPSLRSRSPIAAIDQRLGLDDNPSFGLSGGSAGAAGLEGQSPEQSPEQSSEPAPAGPRIHRKAGQSTPVSAAPRPAAGATAVASSMSSTGPSSGPSAAAPRSRASASAASAAASERVIGPREPMDPGPLFGLEPPSFVIPEPALERGPTRAVEPKAEAPAARAPLPSKARPGTARGTAPAPTVPAAIEPARADARPAPWGVPAPGRPPRPLIVPPGGPNPELRPREPRPVGLPGAAPQAAPVPAVVELVPRVTTAAPAPFIAAAAPSRAATPQASPAESTREAAAPMPAPAPAPTPARASSRAAGSGKLTIDSVSQIGPLDRHFPNRRLFRLRFR